MSGARRFTYAAAVLAAMGTSVIGCGDAAPEDMEPRRMTTAKLLAPTAAAELPASDAKAFQQALGGARIDIDRWAGYVAGTADGALLELHLSGSHGNKAIAGLSIAFVEGRGGATSGPVDARLRDVSTLEIRFNDGSKVVSTHTFGPPPSTNAAHRADANANTLLQRAFNDAEALLRAPQSMIGGSDQDKACVASFLMTVSNSARCVDDVANTAECAAVRGNAVDTATVCQGTKTANVLADLNPNVLTTRAAPTSGLGSLANLAKLFSSFSSLSQPGVGAGGGVASLLPILASLLGGAGAGGGLGGQSGAGSLLSVVTTILPKLFGNTRGLQASPLNGKVSVPNFTAVSGGGGGDDDDDNGP
jgi:hypothetical protein